MAFFEYSQSDIGLEATPSLSEVLRQLEKLKKQVEEHETLLQRHHPTNESFHGYSQTGGSVHTDENDRPQKTADLGVAEEEDGDIRIFDDSTHSNLIYWYEKRSASRLFIGMSVVGLQLTLYTCLLIEAFHLLGRDLVNVQISYWQCIDPIVSNEVKAIDVIETTQGGAPMDQLVCDVDDRNTMYATLAFILMGCFLMYDFFACVRVLLIPKFGRISKFFACCLIFLNVYSALVCALFAFQGVNTGSGYDALINTVGVMFIHELDEAVYKALTLIRKEEIKCRAMGPLKHFCRKYVRLIVPIVFVTFMVGYGWASLSVEYAIDCDHCIY